MYGKLGTRERGKRYEKKEGSIKLLRGANAQLETSIGVFSLKGQ